MERILLSDYKAQIQKMLWRSPFGRGHSKGDSEIRNICLSNKNKIII
jgi:hypothetical protein